MLLFIIVTILFTCYAFVIFFYYISWKQIPLWQQKIQQNKISFSIIVAARNEAENIGKLLHSLQAQSHPKNLFEVIVVDDHSTDHTANIVRSFTGVNCISLQGDVINSYKKKAIETGIAAAKNQWVVCTDADCVVHPDWLLEFAGLIEKNDPVFVAAPVMFNEKKSCLNYFQNLDFLTLQGITAASVYKKVHSMCNGANLAYRRDVFYEVNGFSGIDNIASGDDMLLMHKIWKKYPDRVQYLKSKQSIVETLAAKTWREFLNQRIRWASKAKYYDDKRIFVVLLLVYLFNFSFLVLLVASTRNIQYLYFLLIVWLAKTIIELPFVSSVSRFFGKQQLLKFFFFFQPLHIGYTIFSGFLGSFGKYEWKGRKVK